MFDLDTRLKRAIAACVAGIFALSLLMFLIVLCSGGGLAAAGSVAIKTLLTMLFTCAIVGALIPGINWTVDWIFKAPK